MTADFLRSVSQHIPMLEGVSERNLDLLAKGTDVVSFNKDQIIYSKGEIGETFYIVLKGAYLYRKNSLN
jgi:CRP-like cAMP-binding protein